MSLKYAIIGCGRISPNHIAAALENKLEIIALCDIEKQKMDTITQNFNLSGETKKYVDYKEMLQNERPELVAVCTESGKHGQIALDCIDAGSNLIVEKPIALSLEEADLIIQKANEKNIKVSACHQNRFNKSVQKIREAVEANRFGRLIYGTAHIRWNRGEDYYTQAPWRGTWEQDGGALMNQCIHNIDLLRWMMGDEITEVVGVTDNIIHDYIEAEDFGAAIIKFKNGSYGIIEGTTNVFPENLEETLYIFGEKGTVKAGGKSVNRIEEWRFSDGIDDSTHVKKAFSENPRNIYGFGHTPLYADVINSIDKGLVPYVTAADGRAALELVIAIYKASSEGQSVNFPLTRGSTLDFVGRFAR